MTTKYTMPLLYHLLLSLTRYDWLMSIYTKEKPLYYDNKDRYIITVIVFTDHHWSLLIKVGAILVCSQEYVQEQG